MKQISPKYLAMQQDQSDCGVACLLTVIRYHGGINSLENLRKLSGTSKKGTSFIGLLQASQKAGLDAEGLEANRISDLIEISEPSILHVVIESRQQHYIVFFPIADRSQSIKAETRFRLFDPAKGIIDLTASELENIWHSKAILKLVPNASFEKVKSQKIKKTNWLINLIREDALILSLATFLGIVTSLLGISTAIFSQELIDDILPHGNTSKLWLSLCLVSFLLFTRSGLVYLRGLFIVKQGQDFNNRINQSFYKNLLALPKSFFDTRKIGELIARMNDTKRIQTVLSVISGLIVVDLLVVLTSITFLFVYSSHVGFLILFCVPIYASLLFVFNKSIIIAQRGVMIGYAASESNFVDSMQGIAEIMLSDKQLFFERVNATIYGEFQNQISRLGKLQIKFTFYTEIFGAAIVLAIFGVTSWLVLHKSLKIGEMVALLGIAASIVPAINRIIISNIQIQEALIAFDRMFEFTNLRNEEENGAISEDIIREICIKDISFRFPGQRQTFNQVSMNIRIGEIVGLKGESGGGKSTLLQLIQKFYFPENGLIEVNSRNILTIETGAWRRKIGCVSQEPKIFNGNLLYNITLSDQLDDFQQAVDFCMQSGFDKFFGGFPKGYQTLLGEEGINISGGQKQLVAFARALFKRPQVLLLDEATSGMDKKMEQFIFELLTRIRSSMLTLFVTHKNDAAKFCDRIYILDSGRVTLGISNSE